MIDSRLIPSEADLKTLLPQRRTLPGGNSMYLFPSKSVDILKLDFIFNAGGASQPKRLCAGAVRDLLLEASERYNSRQVAELFDRLGVAMDRQATSSTVKLTVYVLKKYAAEVFPVLSDLLLHPVIGQDEFDVLMAKRRQTLLNAELKTNMMARNLFYEAVYGKDHPEGVYAKPDDVQKLSLADVRGYADQRFSLADATLVLAGNYDDEILKLLDECFSIPTPRSNLSNTLNSKLKIQSSKLKIRHSIPSSVQTTLRVGRILPIEWDDPDYPMFMILNTVLGGYFGSRLMTNIREEKGYTYGIYSMSNMVRGSSVFYVTSDVASEYTEPALKEIYHELDMLRREPVSEDELNLVCNYMAGDFLRSIDGIFERSERFYNMLDTLIDERFTTNLLNALQTATPAKLKELAERVFDKRELTEVIVG
ncbi:MAG: insulinase family protein [Bacteroidales bacterium]|nr:insulinase family protein [Bacteroidales bacterium]